MSTSWSICLIYVISFAIIILIYITTNHIIVLAKKNLFFKHICQKFSLRVLLTNLSLAYKSVAHRKKKDGTTFPLYFLKEIVLAHF